MSYLLILYPAQLGKLQVGHSFINIPVGEYYCKTFKTGSDILIHEFNIKAEIGVVSTSVIKKSTPKKVLRNPTLNQNSNLRKPSSFQLEQEELYRKARKKALGE